jgi:ribosome biogenesis GTPase
MSKRKLTRRQLWRIEKIQAEKQQRLVKNEAKIDAMLGNELTSSDHTNRDHTNRNNPNREKTSSEAHKQGLVVARHGKQIEVLDTSSISSSDNSSQASSEPNIQLTYLCHLRANIPSMVVGDKVIWTKLEDDEHNTIGIIESLVERESLLSRRDKHGQEKIIAANISQVFVVVASEPETPELVIDRYLAACELLQLNVKLLVNKSDLEKSANLLSFLKKHYASVVDDIILCSMNNETQLQTLKEHLKNANSVFIGQSGVGKSSLVKKLIDDANIQDNIKTKTLSARSGLGQHTTSTSRLYQLESGGYIIDSPGIRDFDLDEVSLQELQRGFKEFSEISAPCKFRNCVHNIEPSCEIKNAVEAHKISEIRYKNYLALAQQLELIR